MTQPQNMLRILIADDSATIRTTLRMLLNGEGHEVVGEVGSGAKLLGAIAQLTPNVVCIECKLPDADGLSLLREIHAAHPQIAVVMMSGDNDAELEHAAAKAGAAGFIHKPFSQDLAIKTFQQIAHAQQLLAFAAKKHNPFEGKPGRAKAVIADASRTARQLLVAVLAHMGVEVIGEACDGKHAAELVSEHQPEIVCLNLEMPVMNGLEALGVINSRSPATKAIVISSVASREAAVQAIGAGAKGFILNPFHPNKLIQTVSHMLV